MWIVIAPITSAGRNSTWSTNRRGMIAVGRELAAERERREPRPDERHGQQRRVGDPGAGAGQQVVRQRVAREAFGDGEDEQPEADQPVQLARAAEGSGEEHAAEVEDDDGHERQRRPVVDLPHEQAGAHLEREVHDRVERGRDLLAAEWLVRPVVDDRRGARHVEERHERAGREQDHEAEQRDLAQQERPVVREHLAQRRPDDARDPGPAVDPTHRPIGESFGYHSMFQKAGPTGSG